MTIQSLIPVTPPSAAVLNREHRLYHHGVETEERGEDTVFFADRSPSGRILQALVDEGAADVSGILRQGWGRRSLPLLDPSMSRFLWQDLLEKPVSIAFKNGSSVRRSLSLVDFFREFHHNFPAVDIQLCGGYLRYAIFKNSSYLEQILPFFGREIQDLVVKEKGFFEDFTTIPPDIDIRIFLQKHAPVSRDIFEKIKHFLIAQLSPESFKDSGSAWHFAKQYGFATLKIVYNSCNRFLIASFGNEERTIDIVVIDNLQRSHLFMADDLYLSIAPHVFLGKTNAVPYGNYERGWQAITALLTRTIHGDDLNEVSGPRWSRLPSLIMKGWVVPESSVEERLLDSLRQENESFPASIAKSLRWCLMNHHPNDPLAGIFLTLNACLSLQQENVLEEDLQNIAKSLRDTWKEGQEKGLSLVNLMEGLADGAIPFSSLAPLFSVVALFYLNDPQKACSCVFKRHKGAQHVQLKMHGCHILFPFDCAGQIGQFLLMIKEGGKRAGCLTACMQTFISEACLSLTPDSFLWRHAQNFLVDVKLLEACEELTDAAPLLFLCFMLHSKREDAQASFLAIVEKIPLLLSLNPGFLENIEDFSEGKWRKSFRTLREILGEKRSEKEVKRGLIRSMILCEHPVGEILEFCKNRYFSIADVAPHVDCQLGKKWIRSALGDEEPGMALALFDTFLDKKLFSYQEQLALFQLFLAAFSDNALLGESFRLGRVFKKILETKTKSRQTFTLDQRKVGIFFTGLLDLQPPFLTAHFLLESLERKLISSNRDMERIAGEILSRAIKEDATPPKLFQLWQQMRENNFFPIHENHLHVKHFLVPLAGLLFRDRLIREWEDIFQRALNLAEEEDFVILQMQKILYGIEKEKFAAVSFDVERCEFSLEQRFVLFIKAAGQKRCPYTFLMQLGLPLLQNKWECPNETEVAQKINDLLHKSFEEIFYDPTKICTVSEHVAELVASPGFLPLMRNVDYRSPLAKFTLRAIQHEQSLGILQPVLSLLVDDPLFIAAFAERLSFFDGIRHRLPENVKRQIGERFLAICSDFLSQQKYQQLQGLLTKCSLFQISQKEAAQRVLQFAQTLENLPEELMRVLEWMTQEGFFRTKGITQEDVALCQEKCIVELLKRKKFDDAHFWIRERRSNEQPVNTLRDWLEILLQQEQGVIALEVLCRFIPLRGATITADAIELIERKIPCLEDKQREESLRLMLTLPAEIFGKTIRDTLCSLMEKQTSNLSLVTQGIVACPFTEIDQWRLAFAYFSRRGDGGKTEAIWEAFRTVAKDHAQPFFSEEALDCWEGALNALVEGECQKFLDIFGDEPLLNFLLKEAGERSSSFYAFLFSNVFGDSMHSHLTPKFLSYFFKKLMKYQESMKDCQHFFDLLKCRDMRREAEEQCRFLGKYLLQILQNGVHLGNKENNHKDVSLLPDFLRILGSHDSTWKSAILCSIQQNIFRLFPIETMSQIWESIIFFPGIQTNPQFCVERYRYFAEQSRSFPCSFQAKPLADSVFSALSLLCSEISPADFAKDVSDWTLSFYRHCYQLIEDKEQQEKIFYHVENLLIEAFSQKMTDSNKADAIYLTRSLLNKYLNMENYDLLVQALYVIMHSHSKKISFASDGFLENTVFFPMKRISPDRLGQYFFNALYLDREKGIDMLNASFSSGSVDERTIRDIFRYLFAFDKQHEEGIALILFLLDNCLQKIPMQEVRAEKILHRTAIRVVEKFFTDENVVSHYSPGVVHVRFVNIRHTFFAQFLGLIRNQASPRQLVSVTVKLARLLFQKLGEQENSDNFSFFNYSQPHLLFQEHVLDVIHTKDLESHHQAFFLSPKDVMKDMSELSKILTYQPDAWKILELFLTLPDLDLSRENRLQQQKCLKEWLDFLKPIKGLHEGRKTLVELCVDFAKSQKKESDGDSLAAQPKQKKKKKKRSKRVSSNLESA
ncbi:MAG: hypothetical protein WB791_10085 [Waddliaceae bacterium]